MKPLTVLYGSETGNAQDTAEQIWKMAKRYKYPCKFSALDDYNIQDLPDEEMVVFVVSTTGKGAMPNNMRKFWKFLLHKRLSKDSLSCVQFCVLGLGDSTYEKYNYAARKLYNRLTQLGARPFLDIALANDQDELGIDTISKPFMDSFFKKWNKLNSIKEAEFKNPEIITKFNFKVMGKVILEPNSDIYKLSDETYISGKIISNDRTTADDHFQDVRLIKIRAENLEYNPGDVLCMRPKNSMRNIEKFFTLMEESNTTIKPDVLVKVQKVEIPLPKVLEGNLSIRQLVEQYWDLNAIPSRSVIENLAMISSDELEKTRLFEFCQPGGLDDLYNYVNRPRRTILEVLHDFPKTVVNLDLSNIFEIMTPIRHRAFSIASSSVVTPGEVHLLVAVVKYKTKLFEPRLGLCSNWLAQLQSGSNIDFWIQPGTLMFDFRHPMILVGPGTGVAPFRSLLLERATRNNKLDDCVLFFGCRYKDKDYHCKEDFERLRDNNKLRLYCAFSRDQNDKIYVQHLIKKESKLVWEFLNKNAYIYVAGNAKNMPKAVREEFVNIAMNEGKMSEEEADRYIDQLEQSNQYQEEVWG